MTDASGDGGAVGDLTESREIAAIPTGKFPHGLRLSPNGQELYVANMQDDTVSVLDVTRREEAAQIPAGKTGDRAHGVVVSADGAYACISSSLENTVSAIDVASDQVAETYRVGDGPNEVAIR